MTINEAMAESAMIEELHEKMLRIYDAHPYLTDGFVLECAGEAMLNAEDVGLEMSTEEALAVGVELHKAEAAAAKRTQEILAQEDELRGGAARGYTENDILRVLIDEADRDEDDEPIDYDRALFAKRVLSIHAESLRKEESLHDIHYFQDGGAYDVLLRFKDGKLSAEAQGTLKDMKKYAYRAEVVHNARENLDVVTFSVLEH